MNYRMIAAAVLALSFAGCGGVPGGTSARQPQRMSQSDVMRLSAKMLGAKISPTAKAYATDTIAVHDGSLVGVFPASSKVTRAGSRLTVVDATSGQTFIYSSSATIDTQLGAGRVYVEPGSAMPTWARASNARAVSQ